MMPGGKKLFKVQFGFHKNGRISLLSAEMVMNGQTSTFQPICVFLRFKPKL
jgi:hypothetical protein